LYVTPKEYQLDPIQENSEERMIKKVHAEITHPKCNTDSPLTFLYFFPVSIEIEGIIHFGRITLRLIFIGAVYISQVNIKKLIIRVLFPDNTSQFFPIPLSAIKPVKQFNFLVKTSITIRQNKWTGMVLVYVQEIIN
jgi:hypothetical protein